MVVPIVREHIEAHQAVQLLYLLKVSCQLQAGFHQNIVVQRQITMRGLQKSGSRDHMNSPLLSVFFKGSIESPCSEIAAAYSGREQTGFCHFDLAGFGAERILVLLQTNRIIIFLRRKLDQPWLSVNLCQNFRSGTTGRTSKPEQLI